MNTARSTVSTPYFRLNSLLHEAKPLAVSSRIGTIAQNNPKAGNPKAGNPKAGNPKAGNEKWQ
ncbi:hypothetical protein OAF37_01810 [Rubripirellula sp.]|nr:hypothetical protein [Rubripirellula sp.]MDB4644771.1 hypothetical protein [Rubripirellula sp.]